MANTPRPGVLVAPLSLLFGLSFIAATIVLSAAPIVGLALSGRTDLATLPLALALVGAMAATIPTSRLMARHGRRAGFVIGTTISLVGAVIAAAGVMAGNFVIFCIGSLLLGVLTGVAPFYRFAAVELVGPDWRAKAVSWVLVGGVLAGLAGPPLGAAAAELVVGARFAGTYLVNAAACLLVLWVLPFVRLPAPTRQATTESRRPIQELSRDARFTAAILASFIAYAAMATTMVAAPLSLDSAGHPFASTALVIQAHVVAMFAPSFFTGNLVQRWGPRVTMGSGIGIMLAGGAVNLVGASVPHHWIALVLVGLGWNLLFVAASTLLTTVHTDAERGAVQGLNDFIVAGTLAASALAAGPLFATLGWQALNMVVMAALGLFALLLGVLGRRFPDPAEPSALAASPA